MPERRHAAHQDFILPRDCPTQVFEDGSLDPDRVRPQLSLPPADLLPRCDMVGRGMGVALYYYHAAALRLLYKHLTFKGYQVLHPGHLLSLPAVFLVAVALEVLVGG